MPAGTDPALVGGAWRWMPPASAGAPSGSTERYTIAFGADGRADVRADCNRGAARYVAAPDGRLTVTDVALTKVACGPASMDALFVRQLGDTEGYRIEAGALRLALRSGGNMTLYR
jgi:heat shock protein HslJ